MYYKGALTQRIKPIALGSIIEAKIPAAAVSIPLPGHTDTDKVSKEEVEKAADADIVLDIDWYGVRVE